MAGARARRDGEESGGVTPGAIPTMLRSRVPLTERDRTQMRARLARALARSAGRIERVWASIEDENGPRGGVDIVCRLVVTLSGRPRLAATARATAPRLALARAAQIMARSVTRALAVTGQRAVRESRRMPPPASAARPVPPARGDDGSLIGRRVGRSRANLERALARPEKERRDVFVDTAQPGRSASDRRAGYGATAARNTKRNTAGMQATLEDSRTVPSRKLSRRSANRLKAAPQLTRTVQLAVHAPGAEAARHRARGGVPERRR